MKKPLLTVAAAILLSVTSVRAEEPVAYPVMRLHADLAMRAAQAAIAACRAQGIHIAVTVIDRGGHVQVAIRDTLGMPITIPISQQKAYAALNFNAATSQLEGRFDSPFSHRLNHVTGHLIELSDLIIEAASRNSAFTIAKHALSLGKDVMIMSAGGLPISPASTIVGAIGVSGAPSGETDEECAQAGLDAIMTDVEMGLN